MFNAENIIVSYLLSSQRSSVLESLFFFIDFLNIPFFFFSKNSVYKNFIFIFLILSIFF